MGGKTKTVNNPTQLSERGGKQFDFAAGQLETAFGRDPNEINFNSFGLDRSIGKLNNFSPSGSTNAALNRLSGFKASQGTNNRINELAGFRGGQGAKNALRELGDFKGSGDAFRTLSSLEQFGAREQGFVTDARNSVLNFDEGFESNVLPGLQEAASGKFLTEAGGNPFIRDQIDLAQRSTIDNFNESILPNLLSSFSGTGGVGSTLQAGFANQQARDTQRTLGDISSGISFNVFEAERARQQQAQESILGFENFGLDRQLQARTTNLGAAQTTAGQLLAARQSAGQQATALSQQQLDALSGQASGQVQISGQIQDSLAAAANARVQGDAQRQQALAAAASGRVQGDSQRLQAVSAALGGEQTKAGLDFNTQQLNAQLENDRINQLIAAQQAANNAGQNTQEKFRRSV